MEKKYREDIDLLFLILSGKISMIVNRALVRNFRNADVEITPEQFMVLSYLWKEDGVAQQSLCNATNKDKPSMTRLVDNLEKQSFVVRVADKTDRRNNLIFLTKQGRDIKDVALEAAKFTVEQALTGISGDDVENCRMVLTKVLDNLKE